MGMLWKLTAAGAVESAVLLRVSLQPTVEAVLPELGEPGVSWVVFGTQFQVIIVEPLDVCGLQLYGDAAGGLAHVPVSDVITVRPAVTAKERTN